MQETIAKVLQVENLQGPYYKIHFSAPYIAENAQGGQFVHIKVPHLGERLLRRPFSINSVDPEKGTLTVTFKVVGEGTEKMTHLQAGEEVSILGPLGNAYTIPGKGITPILVDGGYGSAATFLAAKRAAEKAIVLLGARTKEDIILAEDYVAEGCEVKIATNDGSLGHKGFVTELLPEIVKGKDPKSFMIMGCGPTPMLMALGKIALSLGIETELSLDEHMCCGVGACFGCVVKVADKESEQGWRFSRSCKEGPIYKAEEVYYG